LGNKRRAVTNHEVNQLLRAELIKEVKYTMWIANVVMVKKASGEWKMCVDYSDLNKACPNYTYPFPCIDQLVNGTTRYELLIFLDAYSGYNHIRIYPLNEEKTVFMRRLCYRVMPFGLKKQRSHVSMPHGLGF